MSKDRKYSIIILFNNPWNYHCDYEFETALELSRKHHVLALNLTHTVKPWLLFSSSYRNRLRHFYLNHQKHHISAFIPITFIPFSSFPILKQLNHLILIIQSLLMYRIRQGSNSPTILWVFSYTDFSHLKYYQAKSIVYDCIDPIIRSDPDFTNKRKMQRRLAQTADFIFVNSPHLLRQLTVDNPSTYLMPSGCKLRYFPLNSRPIPKDMPRHSPIIGISSGIDWRIDYNLLSNLASNNPNWSFVLIGPNLISSNQTTFLQNFHRLYKLPNVYYLGNKSNSQLASYYQHFDICLIPYVYDHEPLDNNPIKFYEYLAVGKPVVSVPIEALEKLTPHVSFAHSPKQFEQAIKLYLATKPNKRDFINKRQIATDNTWHAKVTTMLRHYQRTVAD